MLRSSGVSAGPDTIVAAGTQTLLSIVCGLTRGGKRVALEEQGFRQAEQVFSDCRMEISFLPNDGARAFHFPP